MRQFDVTRMFQEIGGPAALRDALLADNGLVPTDAVIAMWKHRGRIARAWAAACIHAVLSRRPDLGFEDLIQDIPPDPGDLFG